MAGLFDFLSGLGNMLGAATYTRPQDIQAVRGLLPQSVDSTLANTLQSQPANDALGLIGGVGMAKAATPALETIYRGESAYNKGGNFFTSDPEWALQFTQSGRPSEVLKRTIPSAKIYEPPSPVYAGDADAVDKAIADAKAGGFHAVRLSEARGDPSAEPMSIFVFNKSSLGK